MKNSYKLALLAAIGLAGVSAANAYTSGDLLVGIYDSNASSTTVVDLGSFSSLVNGETWDLTSALSAAGITVTDGNAVYGVVGYDISAAPYTLFATGGNGNTPNNIRNATAFNTPKNDVATIANGTQTLTGGVDWYENTISGGLVNVLNYDLNTSVGTANTLYSVRDNNTAAIANLNFTLDNTGTLTYGTVTVPEPSTYAFMTGAGLLMISFRKSFRRKQA